MCVEFDKKNEPDRCRAHVSEYFLVQKANGDQKEVAKICHGQILGEAIEVGSKTGFCVLCKDWFF